MKKMRLNVASLRVSVSWDTLPQTIDGDLALYQVCKIIHSFIFFTKLNDVLAVTFYIPEVLRAFSLANYFVIL